VKYCQKCDAEYEADSECMCPTYRRRMENGRRADVPYRWKVDNWNGYFNDPGDCEHLKLGKASGDRVKCQECGSWLEAREWVQGKVTEWEEAGTLWPHMRNAGLTPGGSGVAISEALPSGSASR